MSMFSSMASAPTDAAMKYYSQIPAVLQQYLGPYVTAGNNSLNTLTGQYDELTNDPGAKYSQLMSGFEQSPSYEYQSKEGTNAANNAAAAAGGSGGSAHMEDSAKMASSLADQQDQQYYNNVMGLYGKGLGGESHINDMGAQMSGDMAQGLSSNLANEGNMAAMSAKNEDSMIGSMLGLGGDVLGYALGAPTSGGMMGSSSGMGKMDPSAGYAAALKSLFSML